MIMPRLINKASKYDPVTGEMLLTRTHGNMVPYLPSYVAAVASNIAAYLACEGGRAQTIRARWRAAHPNSTDDESLEQLAFEIAAAVCAIYATKYCTKDDNSNTTRPKLIDIVNDLIGILDQRDDTLQGDELRRRGRRFVAQACNAAHSSMVIAAPMAVMYLLTEQDHWLSHEFVTHPAMQYITRLMTQRKVRIVFRNKTLD